MKTVSVDALINIGKSRGFIFQGSEIYGGLANTWDYGPLGVLLKNAIRDEWWNHFVVSRRDMVGLDSSILLNSNVWKASGHIDTFTDPLIDCKDCQSRFRSDKLIEEDLFQKGNSVEVGAWSYEAQKEYLKENAIVCSECGGSNWSDIRSFQLMFETYQGVIKDSSAAIYLRPETAQGIFINFHQVQSATRKKLPFGIGQVGKAFRNEITPGNYIFRTREFEQMEIEYFVKPGTEDEYMKQWEVEMMSFLSKNLGIRQPEKLRIRWHDSEELSHYSSATFDIEYEFPFGWSELWGCASRTDFDISQHMQHASKDLRYLDPQTNEKYVPYVIEPSLGLNRTVFMVLCDAYDQDEIDGEIRTVLRFAPKIAPIQIGICPLVKALSDVADTVYDQLSQHFRVDYDVTGSIGKRYRRYDEVGTPYIVTVDFDTAGRGESPNAALLDTVTVRNRDTLEQDRVPLSELHDYFLQKGL